MCAKCTFCEPDSAYCRLRTKLCLKLILRLGACQVGARVDARVELTKDDYAVLSLPDHGNALGFAATSDFNLRPGDAARTFTPGQRITATVAAAASQETGGERACCHETLFRIIVPSAWAGLIHDVS